MNINQLRTPEGLDHYLNVVLPTLPIKMPDNMLVLLLRNKTKPKNMKLKIKETPGETKQL